MQSASRTNLGLQINPLPFRRYLPNMLIEGKLEYIRVIAPPYEC